MLKWFITIIVALVLVGALSPWLHRLGLGKLPGDIRVRRNGRDYTLPITSTLLLSGILTIIAWALR